MERPISPHLQIYRLPITAIMSIMHRISGMANIAGLLLVSSLFIGAAYGPEGYGRVAAIVFSWPGLALLAVFSLTMCYHLCNGIRHMVWDTGRALDLDSLRKSAPVVFVAAVVVFIAVWI